MVEIAVNNLSTIQDFRQIVNTPSVIGFLQALPEQAKPKRFEKGEQFLQEIAALVTQYLSFTTIYGRKKQLEIIAQKLKDFQLTAAFLKGYVGRGLVKVAYVWGELVTAEEAALQRQIETEPIPNPFVVGNSLRREDKEVFQGREDVARLLENEIMRDKSMSPLLLYGKRRIGKTSTLNNLQKLLGPSIIPVILDCQNVGLAESDSGFLYHFLDKILEKVPADWVMPIDAILPKRQEFDEHPFDMSNKFFDHLSTRMESNNFRLMLCFDEYESLN